MAKKQEAKVKVRGIRRAKVDENQVALAYVLLAQAILAAKAEDAEMVIDGELEAEGAVGGDL